MLILLIISSKTLGELLGDNLDMLGSKWPETEEELVLSKPPFTTLLGVETD